MHHDQIMESYTQLNNYLNNCIIKLHIKLHNHINNYLNNCVIKLHIKLHDHIVKASRIKSVDWFYALTPTKFIEGRVASSHEKLWKLKKIMTPKQMKRKFKKVERVFRDKSSIIVLFNLQLVWGFKWLRVCGVN
jgi:hypothetical protein